MRPPEPWRRAALLLLAACHARPRTCGPASCAALDTPCLRGVCASDGSCVAAPLPEGTPCGDPTSTVCDAPDACDLAGRCVPRHQAAGSPCGDPQDTECDAADSCDGAGACASNLLPAGHACGEAGSDACTAPDRCDGAGICRPMHAAAGAPCGDPSGSACDAADGCDGAGRCRRNLAPPGQPCGSSASGACTAPDACDGEGRCEARDVSDGASCTPCLGPHCWCEGGVCVDPCGDDIRQAVFGEQCDGPDDELCPGACLASCRCGASSCAELQARDPAAQSGLHTLAVGGRQATAWCDLDRAGGGWLRFWWYESNAGLPVGIDTLGEDFFACEPLSPRCFATIPLAAPSELLVETDGGRWAVWKLDAANATAALALGALRDHRVVSADAACTGVAWNPYAQAGLPGPFNCDEVTSHGDQCDCFFYGPYWGTTGFSLDDDVGWLDTGFSAGVDQTGAAGVDALETEPSAHSLERTLRLYVR